MGCGSARHTILASGPHSAPDPAAEISRLRRENDRLRTERDILKKAVAIFSEPPMRFPLIEDHRERLAGACHVRGAERVAVGLLRVAVTAGQPIAISMLAAPFLVRLGDRLLAGRTASAPNG